MLCRSTASAISYFALRLKDIETHPSEYALSAARVGVVIGNA
jgi:hypothetical protein